MRSAFAGRLSWLLGRFQSCKQTRARYRNARKLLLGLLTAIFAAHIVEVPADDVS
jgi:hypothetical protein